MSADPIDVAAAYLTPPAGAIWRWSERGDALEWTDGMTMAFRQEVERVLSALAPRGLPPFGAVALILAACRDGWRDSSVLRSFVRDSVATSLDPRGLLRGPGAAGRAAEPDSRSGLRFPPGTPVATRVAAELVRGLARIAALPRELRSTPEAKALVVEAATESLPADLTPEASALVVDGLGRGVPPEALSGPPAGPAPGAAAAPRNLGLDPRFSRSLVRALGAIETDSLALRIRTGLDRLVRSAALDLPVPEQVRRLLAEIASDPELSGIAKLARDLMAAVHLPRSVADDDELPLGGLSDISNRGPLDRLLASELAHDDHTLAARIALGEALYLRREAPRKSPPTARTVLLDSGVRSWGVPRVFGTAVALALAATARGRFRAFRASGGRAEPVELHTREGLVAHLAALETAAHPGEALEAFLLASGAGPEACEAVLVIPEETLADPDFLECLDRVDRPRLHAATLRRDGGFALVRLGRRANRAVASAVVEIQSLLERPKAPGAPAGRLVDERLRIPLPSILRMSPLPLLLPSLEHPLRHADYSPRLGVVGLTSRGRLLRWREKGGLAEEVCRVSSRGRPRFLSLGEGTEAFIGWGGRRSRLTLVTVDVERRTVARVVVELGCVPEVLVPVGTVVFTWDPSRPVFAVHDMRSGRALPEVPAPGCAVWHATPSSRYVSVLDSGAGVLPYPDSGWYALSFDGLRGRPERIEARGLLEDEAVVRVFDRLGHEGPWALTSRLRVISVADGTVAFSRAAGRVLPEGPGIDISRDGSRIVVGTRIGVGFGCALDLGRSEVWPLEQGCVRAGDAWHDPRAWLATESETWTAPPPELRMRTRLCAVRGLMPDRLAVESTSGTVLELLWIGGPSAGLVPSWGRPDPLRIEGVRASRRLESVRNPGDRSVGLRAATWADGSRAFLDSRGLLHLVSSDADLPEVTIVLCTGPTALWSSRGEFCGAEMFLGPGPRRVDESVFREHVGRFVRRLR